MSDIAALGSLRGPKVLLFQDESGQCDSVARSIEHAYPSFVVRIARGEVMRTYGQLFEELRRVLEFPSYFGRNMNALRDCLTDMEWLPADGYVLLISRARDLLIDEAPKDLDSLIAALGEICDKWSEPIQDGEAWDRPARPFHVVLAGSLRAPAVSPGESPWVAGQLPGFAP